MIKRKTKTDDITVNIDTVMSGSVPEDALVCLTDSVPGTGLARSLMKIDGKVRKAFDIGKYCSIILVSCSETPSPVRRYQESGTGLMCSMERKLIWRKTLQVAIIAASVPTWRNW